MRHHQDSQTLAKGFFGGRRGGCFNYSKVSFENENLDDAASANILAIHSLFLFPQFDQGESPVTDAKGNMLFFSLASIYHLFD
ncbi:hypothetical protein PTKIN_Ptkin03bG0035800 [Pterospermum kingtungense]